MKKYLLIKGPKTFVSALDAEPSPLGQNPAVGPRLADLSSAYLVFGRTKGAIGILCLPVVTQESDDNMLLVVRFFD